MMSQRQRCCSRGSFHRRTLIRLRPNAVTPGPPSKEEFAPAGLRLATQREPFRLKVARRAGRLSLVLRIFLKLHDKS